METLIPKHGFEMSEGKGEMGDVPQLSGLFFYLFVFLVIQCLMEGEEGAKMRERMNELKEDATNALKEDGSSTKALSQLPLYWKILA